MSETDDHASVSTSKKGKSERRGLDGTVAETEEDSDGDMEEAGGIYE